MSRTQRQYVQDILTAMSDAEAFVEDMSFENLEADRRTQYALQRTFEIIGEATKHVDEDLRNHFDEVPWQEMAGMRDVIVHGYFPSILKWCGKPCIRTSRRPNPTFDAC